MHDDLAGHACGCLSIITHTEHTPRPVLNPGPTMSPAALDKPADLTLWPTNPPARVATGRSFSTLREALTEAATAINIGYAQPWIITEDGDILAPNWIKANTDERHLQ
ncbi:hypothetical protein [Methylobacterium sp. SD21]|uniref:hypothetical protein n=1 Tax=Methylobacterium litchii TaxID=3138810 RepID=UPI00313E4C0F